MHKSIGILTSFVFISTAAFCQTPSAQDTLRFYKQEISSLPAKNSRQNRAYAAALADALHTWTLQNHQDSAVQDALFIQARLWLRAQENGRAVVTLFRLRRLFPTLDVNALLPLLTEAYPGLNTSVREQAAVLLKEDSRVPQAPASQREAEALYELSKLSGTAFYPAATAAFESFFTRYPNYEGNNEVELWYGDLHRLNGNYLAAISQYKKADELYPASPYKAASRRMIGDIYADNLKDTETALQIYTQVLRQFPHSSETGIVYKHMAILDENNKQYDSALINYDKAIELLGTSSTAYDAYRGKADVYVKTKQYNDAYDVLHKTAALFQTDKEAASQALLAAAKLANKQLRDPQKYTLSLEKALLVYPDGPTAPDLMYELGQAYETQQPAKAKEMYKKLVLKYPTAKQATKAQKRLARLEK